MIRIGGVPEHFNLPWHMGIESGAFNDAGLEVQYNDYPGGTGALTRALAEGELDIAIVLTEGVTAAILKGNDSKIIKTYVESPLIWGIHTGVNNSITSTDQMAGKRYAISRFGSGSNLMAIVDAAQRGLSIEKEQFVKVGNLEGARKALAKDEADLFLWEKFMTKPLVDKGEFRRIGETLTPWPCFMAATPSHFLSSHAGDLRTVLDIAQQQAKLLMDDPESPVRIAERYGLQVEDAQAWFSETRWSQNFDMPEQALQYVINSLNNLGIIKEPEALPQDVFVKL